MQRYFLTVFLNYTNFFLIDIVFQKEAFLFHTATFMLLCAQVTFGIDSLWVLSVLWEEDGHP